MNPIWLIVFLVCAIAWGLGTLVRTAIYKNTKFEFDNPKGYQINQLWYAIIAVINVIAIMGIGVSGVVLLIQLFQ
jgi:hypothetical protein